LKWYALYVKSRAEKKVAERLRYKGFEVFCPLNKVMKQWSDRKKLVEEPYFRGYVFVKFSENERLEILRTQGVVQIVHWLGKIAEIKEKEMQEIQDFFQQYGPEKINVSDFKAGQEVSINHGPFKDFKAIVLDQSKKNVTLQIPSLGLAFMVTIDKNKITKNNHKLINKNE